jgi:hypothetical protein
MTADLVTVVMARAREAQTVRQTVRQTTLRCTSCRGWLPDEAFSPDARQPNRRGRRGSCRSCNAATRAARPGTRPTTLRQEQLRAWWMERYTMAEIREMAAALELTLGRTP